MVTATNNPAPKRVHNHDKLTVWVTIIVVTTLASILVGVSVAFVIGLFLPNTVIDNKDILPIIAPAFHNIVGGFVGLIAGIKIGKGHPDAV